ncbi:DUF3800 domain-containing protein [Granulicella aggregans]|uniref:DUF3800 domain-containing protein n=1 Tax=Granulicella aggregans TaxID=474949 RepID=UPI0021E00EB9|nr:DUF3800 domain-containing protein [Granulicella aggregans]
MLFRAYLDDSSDQKKQAIAVAGAAVGTKNQWKAVTDSWNKRLDADGIEYFKYFQYRAFRGQFFKFRKVDLYPPPKGSHIAGALFQDLQEIISNSGVRGMAHAIPLCSYAAIRKSSDRAASIFPVDPYEAAMQTLMGECADRTQESGEKNRVAFVSDDSNTSRRVLQIYKAFKTMNPDKGKVMKTLFFGDDKLYPQLQVADLMAGLVREICLTARIDQQLHKNIVTFTIWSDEMMIDMLAKRLEWDRANQS